MDCEYVRRHYGVPAEIGRRVVVYGKPGVIAADRGHYLGVNFDADKPGVIHNAHPTSEVEYGELATVRPMTRSQKRYMESSTWPTCTTTSLLFSRRGPTRVSQTVHALRRLTPAIDSRQALSPSGRQAMGVSGYGHPITWC